MLRERGRASLDSQGRLNRCFTDGEFELTVFLEPDASMLGFELTFAVEGNWWMLSWAPVEQYLCHRVEFDAPRENSDRGRRLTRCDPGVVDTGVLFRRLKPATAGIEPRLRSFVLELVLSHADEIFRCRYCSERAKSDWHCSRCWLRACAVCMARKSLAKSRCTWTEATHEWIVEAPVVTGLELS